MRIAIEGCWPAARQTSLGPKQRWTAAALCWKHKKDSALPLIRKTACTGQTFRPKRPPSLSRK